MALFAKVGTLSCPGSTGNQAITGVGFQPKAVLFWGNKRTSAGSSSSQFQFYVGMATSSTSRACAAMSNGAFRTDNRNTSCVYLVDDGGSTVLTADFVSMDSDGFTINWSTVSSGVQVNYLALGGSDLTNAAIKQLQAPASTGSQAYTGVGFQPGAVIAVSVGDTTTPNGGALSRARFGMGAASGSSAQWATSSEWEGGSANGYQRTNQVIAVIGNGAKVVEANLTSFDSDGFTLNWGTTTNGVYCWFLCLKGGQFKAGSISQKTSTGNQAYTGVGFQPVAELFASRDLVASTTIDNNEEQTMIGAASSTSARAAIISNWGGLSTDQNTLTTTKAIRLQTGSTPTVQAEADLVSHDSDGFTLNWSTADATSREIVYLAFGSAAASGATGTIAATAQKATASFSGAHAQTGTLAATLQRLTAALTGVMQPTGTIAAAMQRLTANLAGTQQQTGTMAGTLQFATASLSGTHEQTGSIAAAMQPATASLSGVMHPSGTLGATMQPATAAAAGTQSQEGALAATMQQLSAALAGTHEQTGTVAATMQPATAAALGVMHPTGTIAATLQPATAAFAEGTGVSGSIAATLQAPTAGFSGDHAQTGSVAASVQPATAAFAGEQTQDGAIAASLQRTTAALAGTQAQSGDIAASLQPATAALTAEQQFLGTLAATLQAATGALSGEHAQTGSLAAALQLLTFAGIGQQPTAGVIAATLQAALASFTDAVRTANVARLTGSYDHSSQLVGSLRNPPIAGSYDHTSHLEGSL